MSYHQMKFFSSFLMLTWLVCSLSIKNGLLKNSKTIQNESFENNSSNDELGGSLLNLVTPTSGKSPDFFDSPNPRPKANLQSNPNLQKIIANINSPPSLEKQKKFKKILNDKTNYERNVGTNSKNRFVYKLKSNENTNGIKNHSHLIKSNNNKNISHLNLTSNSNTTISETFSKIKNDSQSNISQVVDSADSEETKSSNYETPQFKNKESNASYNSIVSNEAKYSLINIGLISKSLPSLPIKRNKERMVGITGPNLIEKQTEATSNSACNITLSRNIHAPYPVPETANMRYLSLIAFIIFGSVYLALRFSLSFFKGGDANFFTKGVKMLSNQSLLYFFLVAIFMLLYTFGALDSIAINWEFFIASLSLFGISWIIFNVLVISFCLMITHKWKTLEHASKDSYKNIKLKYEAIANNNYNSDSQKKIDPSGVFELYEYLTMKIYFCLPFYPSFKPCNLRREFRFNVYLTYCLLQKLRLFFKFSITSWVFSIFLVFIWSVFIVPQDTIFITAFILCFPLLGLGVGLILYYYMRSIYRRVVQEINKDNYMSYLDLEHFNQHYATGQFINFPVYIDTLMKMPEDSKMTGSNLHEHFHSRPASLYEDQLFFGATGFILIINTLQAIGFVFIMWSVVLFVKHYYEISMQFGYICLAFIIPTLLIYLVLYCYLISISLRWYTIISSIEMNRNEDCTRKTINYHTKKSAEMSNTIFMSFKRLYFDMKISLKNRATEIDEKHQKEEFNSLGRLIFQKMIDSYVCRFKNVPSKNDDPDLLTPKSLDDYPINMNMELRAFLKSCGNKLDEKEIEFMLHMIEKFDTEERTVTRTQLYDICGIMIHFGTLPPEEIINDVFDQYFESRKDIPSINRRDTRELTIEIIDGFLDYYNEYFSQEERIFMEQEIHYLGEKFSRDAFTYSFIATRRYHPN